MGLPIPCAEVVIAPCQASQNNIVSAVAPTVSITEDYTWVLMGLFVGLAGGNALAGALVDSASWRAAVLSGCVLAGLGAVVAWARRGTPAPAPPNEVRA